MEKNELLKKQTELFVSEIEEKILEVAEKCINEDGVIYLDAILNSYARAFTACMKTLVEKSENNTKYIVKGLRLQTDQQS